MVDRRRAHRAGSRALLTVVAGLVASVLAGCGQQDEASVTSGGAVPLSAPALAWLVDQHVDGDATEARPMVRSDVRTLGADAVGVELRFRPSEGEDGELVRAFVAAWRSPGMQEYRSSFSCASGADGCAVVDGVTVRWQVGQPEEDPGYVVALRRRGATATVASYSGPDITGDPRRMDLPVSTDDLVALIRDPRVALTTTAETVEASSRFEVYDDPATPGRDLPDPDLTEPATSATLALLAQGHTAWDADRAYADPSVPSPGIGVVLDFPTQGGWEATTLRTSLVPVAGQPSTRRLRRTAGCDDSDGCAPFGSVLVAWTLAGRDDPGSITVVGWRAGTLMRASWSGQPVTTDPRDRDGPVLVEEIASLAEDPHLGLLASADLAARAADMPSWWQP